MGIRHLNKFLRKNCSNSIQYTNVAELSGKKIAVDISIYLYKYEADGLLLENMYLMLSIFRYYNVIPIFIFDGKPPQEKKALLIKRKEDRVQAIEEFDKLKQLLQNTMEYDDKQEIIANMDQLKKQIVQISREKIEKVKQLIRSYGATYYDAPGEADELCASLVIKKQVWACLSEDMDLFVYGCTRVLRYFSLVGHSVVLYDMKGILGELNMTHKEFKEICILSGTDYNLHVNDASKIIVNLDNTIKHFNKYKSIKDDTKRISFYEWLHSASDYINDIDLLSKINKMFDLNEEHCNLDIFKSIKIVNGPIRQSEIECIMKEDGFIFI
uniref:XPG N-terminal domain-containing protein n=1 Tax=viral metagenome TaxID=1070528 RepID=A0A6C0IUK7_9ZZZZ